MPLATQYHSWRQVVVVGVVSYCTNVSLLALLGHVLDVKNVNGFNDCNFNLLIKRTPVEL